MSILASIGILLNNNSLGLGAVIVGDSNAFGPISGINLTNTNIPCHMNGIYTIAGTTVFTLDHVVTAQYFYPTGGKPSNILGYTEVYATVEIVKLA